MCATFTDPIHEHLDMPRVEVTMAPAENWVASLATSGGKPPAQVRFSVLSTGIDCLSPKTFLDVVGQYLAAGVDRPGRYVVFRDVHGIVLAENDPTLRAAHTDAFIVCPDGLPLTWLARLKGNSQVERVCGPDMLPLLCREGVERGWRHVFFGSTQEILQALAGRLREAHPGIIIADLISPPFHEPDAAEAAAQLARIRAAKPDIVWVGLGSPKQELWMHRNATAIPGALCMGVGAAFDLGAGTIRRAPPWMQRLGLEWCFRIVQEPQRLAGRYVTTVPRFLMTLTMEYARTRRRLVFRTSATPPASARK